MKHTPLPFRIGDAGHTVFGPPNGKPSPEIVAGNLSKANAAFIARACNAHDDLVACLQNLFDQGIIDAVGGDMFDECKEVLAKARGES